MYNLQFKNTLSFNNSPSVICSDPQYNNGLITKYNPYSPGLVFWLDGLFHDWELNGWESPLVNSSVFNVVDSTNNESGVFYDGKCWHINNASTSDKNSLQNTVTLTFPWQSCTIECTYECTKTSAQNIFVPKGSGNICFGFSGNSQYRFIISNTSGQSQFDSQGASNRGLHTASINVNGGIMDAEYAITNYAGANYLSNTGTYNGIGATASTNYGFTGKIYAIRVYNRLLSTDEMIHNQETDIKRFGLNI